MMNYAFSLLDLLRFTGSQQQSTAAPHRITAQIKTERSNMVSPALVVHNDSTTILNLQFFPAKIVIMFAFSAVIGLFFYAKRWVESGLPHFM